MLEIKRVCVFFFVILIKARMFFCTLCVTGYNALLTVPAGASSISIEEAQEGGGEEASINQLGMHSIMFYSVMLFVSASQGTYDSPGK